MNTELLDFDILAFSETWLSSAVKDEDLLIQLFNSPERKDRVGDRYGGVIVYIKEGIQEVVIFQMLVEMLKNEPFEYFIFEVE